MLGFLLGLYLYLFLAPRFSGQLYSLEMLSTESFCNFSPFSLDCGDDRIAVERVLFAYRAGCESTCCSFDSTDCFINSTDLETGYVRRTCSGHQSCNLDLAGNRDFCNFGTLEPSYIAVQYYCIPESRILSICSSSTLSSDGSPLYLTNENYPSVTTGDSTCSCSLEVYDCSSSIHVYTIDADLYYDTSYCNQSIEFVDGSNTSLKHFSCESYYGSPIEMDTLSTHYLKINFIDNVVEDQEGYFFLSFAASEQATSFSISCSAEPESWCVGCGSPPLISNGYLQLKEQGNTNYESKALTFCDDGYETVTPEVMCSANSAWEGVVCTIKDCGPAPSIPFGDAQLVDDGNSTYGAETEVTCDPGYETNKPVISCMVSGVWDNATCVPKHCVSSISVAFGSAPLDDINNSTYGATATVICIQGYESGKGRISCLQTGSWETVNCTPKDCGSSFSVVFGSASLDETNNSSYGATANVTCIQGYESGKERISCLQTGSWETVNCTPKDCGPVPSIQHGYIDLREDSNTSYGATAEVVCDSSYRSTTGEIVCPLTGIWENVSSCILKEESGNEHTGASKERKDGLSAGYIALIVVMSLLAGAAVVVVSGYAIYNRTRAVTPASNKTEVPTGQGSTAVSQTLSETANEAVLKRNLVPEVPKRHEIKHGPVYIDHGEAHIFGITIHLPHPFAHTKDTDMEEQRNERRN